jgi:signal peptidase I
MWVTAILTVFGAGLPSVYCGSFVSGLALTFARIIINLPFTYLLYTGITIQAKLMALLLGVSFFTLVLIYNIRFTIKVNRLFRPRMRLVWLWIIVLFIIDYGASYISNTIIKDHLFQSYEIDSQSMENTIVPGDEVFVIKGINPETLRRGDLIVIRDPIGKENNWITRLAAKVGDTIEIADKQVIINHISVRFPPEGIISDTDHIYPYMPQYLNKEYWESGIVDSNGWGPGKRDNMPEYVVPPNEYFVLGDNRDNSIDIRFFGLVDKNNILGKARFIHFSYDSEHLNIRWNQMGKRLDDYRQPS